jgi:hypothetical protein
MDIYVGYALFHVAINQWGYIYMLDCLYVGLYVYRISTINGEIYIYFGHMLDCKMVKLRWMRNCTFCLAIFMVIN